ncbi:hypothetical protein [Pelotalea chapellei]|uniref:Uncharacterized protein n=1 Tax=Pelotalea chapellei TaxID=44671 RepID=A0ABS5U534_9BACT|nr:hypothetical protein [Pelotalea chapellei]MBT1070783.1 hypothetical protein [Pelotalea chapellei]
MNDTNLLERLSRLGLPLMETSKEFDVNQTLAEVVKSPETRFWEAFPVLLANAARELRFDYQRTCDNLTTDEEKDDFRTLLILSAALYESYHLSFFWMKQMQDKFSDQDKSRLKQVRNALAHDLSFSLGGREFQPERLKGTFELYFEKDAEKNRQRKDTYEELSLEYALSQLFSPKQKELFRKKLDGLPLTKTEKEYYSRAVKKKVVALANTELHRMARIVMGL